MSLEPDKLCFNCDVFELSLVAHELNDLLNGVLDIKNLNFLWKSLIIVFENCVVEYIMHKVVNQLGWIVDFPACVMQSL